MKHNLDQDIDNLVISSFPYPISANYRRMLEAESWETKTRICIEIFEFSVKVTSLSLISNYLRSNVDSLSDLNFDKSISKFLPRSSLGNWVELLFVGIHSFQEKQNLLFIPELYDLYWDSNTHPHRPKRGTRENFYRIVEIRNDLAHRISPASESAWSELGKELLYNLRKVLQHLSFFQNYDVVLVEKQETEELTSNYKLTHYKGVEPTYEFVPKNNYQEIKVNSIYLLARNRNLLELSPFIVSWTEEGHEADLAAVY